MDIQCQVCGIVDEAADGWLPDFWVTGAFESHPHQTGLAFCPDCQEWAAKILIIDEEPPGLMGSEYDEEFDPDYWGPDDIGLRAPTDGYWMA